MRIGFDMNDAKWEDIYFIDFSVCFLKLSPYYTSFHQIDFYEISLIYLKQIIQRHQNSTKEGPLKELLNWNDLLR